MMRWVRQRREGAVLVAGMLLALGGCPKPERQGAGVATSKPVETPAPATQPAPAQADPDNRVEIRLLSLDEQQDGWLRIEALREGAKGAWASGSNPTARRIVIDTENVDQFSINCAQLRIDWSGRVVLRIDGRSSELMRKKHPLIHFRRSPAGSWDVVKGRSK